jgi:hypothetical protein
MGVFWSGTDEATISSSAKNHDFLISLVTNKKEEVLARLDIYAKDNSPFKKILRKKYELNILYQINPDLTDEQHKKKDELEKLLDEIQTDYNKMVKDIEKEIQEINFDGVNPDLEEQCKKEVDEKIVKPFFDTHSYGRGNYYRDIWDKKKETNRNILIPEKKDTKEQDAFENFLENMDIKNTHYNNDDETYYNHDDKSGICPFCERNYFDCDCVLSEAEKNKRENYANKELALVFNSCAECGTYLLPMEKDDPRLEGYCYICAEEKGLI